MNKPVPEPPQPGWIQVSGKTAALIRAGGLDDIAVQSQGPARDVHFAPAWAEAICSTDVAPRVKLLALKKAARDPEAAAATTTLVCCIDAADRKQLVEELGLEFAQTIVCACGGKFESASDWREHVEYRCPRRATTKL